MRRKREHRGDHAQEADPGRGIRGTHERNEIAEVRNVRRTSGGRELCGGPRKRLDGVFPGRPHSFQH